MKDPQRVTVKYVHVVIVIRSYPTNLVADSAEILSTDQIKFKVFPFDSLRRLHMFVDHQIISD